MVEDLDEVARCKPVIGHAGTARSSEFCSTAQASPLLVKAVCSLLVASVVFQQVSLPSLGIPLTLGLQWLLLAYLWLSGNISLGIKRLSFAAGASLFLAISLGSWFATTASTPSIFSLIYVSACWLPFLFVVPPSEGLTRAITKTYIRVVGALASVAILQFVVQVIGGPFLDVMSLLPPELTIPNYVHRARLEIPGFAGLIRSNGMVFLEPSIASQFFALGAIICLRTKPLLVPVFVLAVLFTGSGTGLIALAVGLLGIAVTGRMVERLLCILAIGLGTFVMASTGLGESMFSRSAEFQTDGTSASFRFVDPWEHLARFASDSPEAVFFGIGPGGVSLTSLAYGAGVNYTFAPKMIIEYGLILGIASTLAIALVIGKSSNLTLAARLTLIAMTFALSGALGQPASSILLWCLCQPRTVDKRFVELQRRIYYSRN